MQNYTRHDSKCSITNPSKPAPYKAPYREAPWQESTKQYMGPKQVYEY